MWNRRKFITYSSVTAASLFLPGIFPGKNILARADAVNSQDPDHFFVLIRTSGGLDCTLGLDPQIHAGTDQNDVFLEYGPNDIIQVNQVRLAPAAAPLKAFGDSIATLNGVFMSSGDLGHQVGNSYISSGTSKASPTTLPFNLGFVTGTGPFGIVEIGGSDSQTNGIVVSDAQNILSGQVSADNLASSMEPAVKNTDSSSALAKSEHSLIQATQVAPKVQKLLADLGTRGIQPTENHGLAIAFASGGARQAEINITDLFTGLDTHSSHPQNHLAAQLQIWTRVAQLFTDFKSIPFKDKSVFDATTFMVISEFSRTPALNGDQGKDHNNMTTSVLFAGHGINAGQTFGKSIVIARNKSPQGTPIHMGMPINVRTGEPATDRENGQFIQPTNVGATVAAIFGNPDGLPFQGQWAVPGLAAGV